MAGGLWGPGGAGWGHVAGGPVGGGGPRDLRAQGGLGPGPVGRRRKAGCGAPERRDAAGGCCGPGNRRGPGAPPAPLRLPSGSLPRGRVRQGCGSAEPTPAHILRESMLSAAFQLPAESPAAPAPAWPRCSQSWGWGCAGDGRCARWSPLGASGPCPAFAWSERSPRCRPRGWAWGRGCHSGLPRARWPEAWRHCRWQGAPARGAPAARTAAAGLVDWWKGVCEPGDVGAHTLAVTHKALVS